MTKLADVTELTYKSDLSRCVRLHFNDYDKIKDSWLKAESHYEGKDEHGDACCVTLKGLVSIYQRSSEGRVKDIEEGLLISKLQNTEF